MSAFDRREFLNRSALLAAVAASAVTPRAAPAAATRRAGSANDRVRVAVVGVRGRGMSHVKGYLGRNDCDITHVCDCDHAVIGEAMAKVTEGQATTPKFVRDFRKLLDDKSVDVVSIATPNHWHALMAVWAMRAGKDVYVEKPATHNVREGALMVKAARKYGRVCQVGTQSRSNPGLRDAIAYIHAGKIGPVSLAYGTCYKPRKSIGKVAGPTAVPKSIDYDLWCGPAPKLPVTRAQLHYDWHWTWAYGNGDFGNQGVHEADKARWGLNASTLPTAVTCAGGRFGYTDDGETANTQLALYDYGASKLLFEVRGLDTADYKGSKVGNIWFGETGYVVCPNYAGGTAFDRDGAKVRTFQGGDDNLHFDNFIAAVRSRKVADLNCDIAEGHLSAALCHLANVSYRLGEPAPLTAAAFPGCPEAGEALARMRGHLAANKVPAAALGRVGPTLAIDPGTERVTAAGGADVAKANAMLFREYRKGYDLTEAV